MELLVESKPSFTDGIKLQDLCKRLNLPYDDARYVLARGALPPGMDPEPGRGNHRLFNPSQAFHLAVVLKLKAVGVQVPEAIKISEWIYAVQGYSVNLGWDWQFRPLQGRMRTEQNWFLDVGDSKYVRVVTDANPSKPGLSTDPWTEMSARKVCQTARPSIIIRVDIAEIARQMAASATE